MKIRPLNCASAVYQVLIILIIINVVVTIAASVCMVFCSVSEFSKKSSCPQRIYSFTTCMYLPISNYTVFNGAYFHRKHGVDSGSKISAEQHFPWANCKLPKAALNSLFTLVIVESCRNGQGHVCHVFSINMFHKLISKYY